QRTDKADTFLTHDVILSTRKLAVFKKQSRRRRLCRRCGRPGRRSSRVSRRMGKCLAPIATPTRPLTQINQNHTQAKSESQEHDSNHTMIRERVSTHGVGRPLEPEP